MQVDFETEEVKQARKALRCLYLEVHPSIANDVSRLVEAAFSSLGEKR